MNRPAPQKPQSPDPLAGLSESERQALARAAGNNESSRDPNELMSKAYAKTGIDPLQADAMRNPNHVMAKIQGPILAAGGLLFVAIGVWRILNAWSYSAISIGGIAMLIIGLVGLVGGLAGTIYVANKG